MKKIEYEGLNHALLECILRPPHHVLDLGCGTGNAGRYIRDKWGAEVLGVTYSEKEAEKARSGYSSVEVCDLNVWKPSGNQKFDLILCSHVLEHLYEPKTLLKKIQTILKSDGVLLVALPNVLFWRQRILFLKGKFRYTDGGIMDSTHYRFFDYKSAQELILSAGYDLTEAKGDGVVPIGPLRRLLPESWIQKINRWGLKWFPGLFAWQILLIAKIKITGETS